MKTPLKLAGMNAALAIIVGLLLCIFCNTPAKSWSAPMSSVAALQKNIKLLRTFEIESCDVTVCVTQDAKWFFDMPSPSDRSLQMLGHVMMSDSGAKKLKTEFEWTSVNPAAFPGELRTILPAGPVLTCRALNQELYESAGVAIVNDDWHKMYFIARDMNHGFNVDN